MAEPRRSLRRERRRTREAARGVGKLWIGLARAVFYSLTAALSRTRAWGMRNVPERGPALLVLNHVSHLDPIYDAVTVHRTGRIPRFLAKADLWRVKVVGSLLTGAEQIPVPRGTADVEKSLQAAHEALREGKIVLIYPDGTITKDPDGWPMRPKSGLARLALHHDVPVIPVARWGTRDIYDHYAKRFRPFPRKRVTYHFGEPVDLSALREGTPDAHAIQEVTLLVMGRVRALLGGLRGEQPPEEYYSPRRGGSRGRSGGAERKRGDDGAA
ncbi:lysophospholipid acyltransferase family protein [Salinifilum ghardaiensis]